MFIRTDPGQSPSIRGLIMTTRVPGSSRTVEELPTFSIRNIVWESEQAIWDAFLHPERINANTYNVLEKAVERGFITGYMIGRQDVSEHS